MKSLVVIAIGSRIMKDDGIGLWVAESIRNTLSQENVDVVIAETDFEFGFEAIKPYKNVIVLDAMVSGDVPGNIAVLPLLDLKAQIRKVSLHDLSLIDMIIYEGNALGSFIGIEAKEVDYGFGMSEALQDIFEAICGNVQKEVLKIKEGLTNA
jgi:hydrogenase maturation protease